MGKKSRRQRVNSVPQIPHDFAPVATTAPTLPSRVTWCVARVAWRATAPRSATPWIGRSTRKNAAASGVCLVGGLIMTNLSVGLTYPRKTRIGYGRRVNTQISQLASSTPRRRRASPRSRRPTHKGRNARNPPPQHQRVDVVRPLVRVHGLQVHAVADDVVLVLDAVASE